MQSTALKTKDFESKTQSTPTEAVLDFSCTWKSKSPVCAFPALFHAEKLCSFL